MQEVIALTSHTFPEFYFYITYENVLYIKRQPITLLFIQQLQKESDWWKRKLEFLAEENIHLKMDLGDLIKDMDGVPAMMEQIEHFHNSFIKEDETINVLRNELRIYDKLLLKDLYADGTMVNEVLHRQKKLREKIRKEEKVFNELKFDFYNYAETNQKEERL